MPWARLDDGFHDHPKVDGLSLGAVGLYTLCLTWAHRHRRSSILPGHITEARVRKLAGRDADKLATELVTAGLWELEDGIGGYVIHDFADYLPKERDPAERKEAGRKGAAKRWQGDSKPDGKLPSDSMASDSSRVSAPASPSRPVPSEQPSLPRKRGTRLDPDWKPPQAEVEWRRENGISDLVARRELPKFIDFWQAKAGPGGVKLDWLATWRNWLRNAQEREPQRPVDRENDSAGWAR